MEARISLVIPLEHAGAANRIAAIFDPDIGGHNTFGSCELAPTSQGPATHYMASGLIKSEYIRALTHYDTALPILQALAAERNRDQPDPIDVKLWCDNAIVGDPGGLVRVDKEPAV